MSLVKEFREFAIKGNVVDLAVGVIIGAAFGKIVSSLVADVIMPPVGLLVGGVDFKHLAWTMKPAPPGGEAVTLRYGIFIQQIFDFFIMATAVFLMVKLMNRLRRKEAQQPAAPPTRQEQLLEKILQALEHGRK
jgi:large conductance mechanosensitive channel